MAEVSPIVTDDTVPVLDIDPFDLDVLRNPLDFFATLRDAAPMVFLPRYNTYAVGRYEAVRQTLWDWESFTSAGGVGLGDIRKGELWRSPSKIVEVDPPVHTGVRSAMNKILSPRVIRSWRESFELEADRLLTEVFDKGTFDGVREIAEAFVLTVFPPALGVEVDRDLIVTVSDYNFNTVGPQNALYHASKAKADPMMDRMLGSFERDALIPGGFAQDVYRAEDEGQMGEGVANSVLRSLLRGGMDTTISGIGSALMLLAQHPDQFEALRADPELARSAFDETIRMESPIQSFYRTTTKPVEFEGYRLAPDVKVQMFPGAANRDPRHWDRPAVFDIKRTNSLHLAFGMGVHNCIGQMIARLESEAVLKVLARRVAKFELAGEPSHRPINTLRTLDSLPLRVHLA